VARTTEAGTAPALLRTTTSLDHQVEDVLELAPRLAWQPTAVDSVTASGYLRERRIGNAKGSVEHTEVGDPTAFPHAQETYDANVRNAYADLAWTRKFDSGARFSTKLSGFSMARGAAFVYRGMDAQDTLLATHDVASDPTEREWTLSGSWRRPLWGNHALAAGWEAGRKERDEYRRERQRDADGALLLSTDENYRATVVRSAFFLQDEWDIDAAWSAYAGLRREDLRTTGEGNAATPVNVAAGAWSPIFQALFKPQRENADTGPRDQFRLAVSRTYKAPNIVQLMPRRYTVDNDNSATNPDQQGNPALRPELALNFDLAWERTYGKAGMVSVSAFNKRIRDITLTRLYESAGVWIATPDNMGSATVRGLEFEGKATRGAWSERVNLARNWSHVDRVPGPDNRIEGQAAWSGNVGVDHVSVRADFGGTLTLRGPVVNRSSALLLSDDGSKRQLDVYAVWKRDQTARLRLSVANLLHRDYREGLVYDDGGVLARTVMYRTHATWRLVWEQSL
jgi:outer membrane receptor protein involved in Fe transport